MTRQTSQSAYTITSSTATGDWNRKRAEEIPYPNEWPNAIVPQMGTFKPKIPLLSSHTKENIRRDSSHNTNKTNNNVRLNGLNLHSNVRNISKPAIKPKPLALRRERSDLTGSTSARRLAYHAENHSPGPLCSSPRRALLPPSDSLDGNALIGCLEELKRKRYT
ncbi:unnamed protein product [Anisakis simplex]|uniref:Uncharacterized protein n=1 Tax=Anisakis simplex TaxID=6269 RepID=A0A0M3J5T2_ANISI|nr:unnamed protein product [Anisakis simplex]